MVNRFLLFLLPLLLPIAVRWVRKQEFVALSQGEPLGEQGRRDARAVGVEQPEKIRLLVVGEIPGPQNPLLKRATRILGFFGPSLTGITYRYGIFIRKDRRADRELVAHECAHTAQYERLGGLRPFLKSYLEECLRDGYPDGPLEQEAIRKAGQIHD